MSPANKNLSKAMREIGGTNYLLMIKSSYLYSTISLPFMIHE